MARGGGTAGLVIVNDDHPVGKPAPGDGPVTETALNPGRFLVVRHLAGARLADVDPGQAIQMDVQDLGGPIPVANRPVDGPLRGAGLEVGEHTAGMGLIVAHGCPPWRSGPGGTAAGGDARSGSVGSVGLVSVSAKGVGHSGP